MRLLAFGAGLPRVLVGFIAADVDVFRGEKLHDFRQDILQEFKGLFVADAELGVLVRLARAGHFRIGGQYLFGVGGHLYFGDDGDVALGGIGQQLADVVLRVVAAVGTRSSLLAILASAFEPPVFPYSLRTPGGELRQARILLDFDTPACAVGQVQVQAVQLEAGHGIHLLLDVRDVAGRHLPLAFAGRRGQLHQGLQTVEQAGICAGRNVYALRRHAQFIAFRCAGAGVVQLLQDDACLSGRGVVAVLQACAQERLLLEVIQQLLQLIALQVTAQPGVGIEGE